MLFLLYFVDTVYFLLFFFFDSGTVSKEQHQQTKKKKEKKKVYKLKVTCEKQEGLNIYDHAKGLFLCTISQVQNFKNKRWAH